MKNDKNKYKLIAIDVDGTLVNSKKEMTKENAVAISKASNNGVIVLIASGRPLSGLKQYESPFTYDTPFITFNGSYIVTKDTKKVIYNQPIDFCDGKSILKFIYDNNINVIIWANNQLYVNKINGIILNYGYKSGCQAIETNDYEYLCKIGINKILLYGDNLDLTNYKNVIKDMNLNVNLEFSSPYYLEIFHASASKGNAIKVLCEYYNISIEETIAIGDNYNDLSMLKASGKGIVMRNSPDEIKNMGYFVTGTNEESGVAEAIYKFVLNDE